MSAALAAASPLGAAAGLDRKHSKVIDLPKSSPAKQPVDLQSESEKDVQQHPIPLPSNSFVHGKAPPLPPGRQGSAVTTPLPATGSKSQPNLPIKNVSEVPSSVPPPKVSTPTNLNAAAKVVPPVKSAANSTPPVLTKGNSSPSLIESTPPSAPPPKVLGASNAKSKPPANPSGKVQAGGAPGVTKINSSPSLGHSIAPSAKGAAPNGPKTSVPAVKNFAAPQPALETNNTSSALNHSTVSETNGGSTVPPPKVSATANVKVALTNPPAKLTLAAPTVQGAPLLKSSLAAPSGLHSTPPTPTERTGPPVSVAAPKVTPVSAAAPRPTLEGSSLFNHSTPAAANDASNGPPPKVSTATNGKLTPPTNPPPAKPTMGPPPVQGTSNHSAGSTTNGGVAATSSIQSAPTPTERSSNVKPATPKETSSVNSTVPKPTHGSISEEASPSAPPPMVSTPTDLSTAVKPPLNSSSSSKAPPPVLPKSSSSPSLDRLTALSSTKVGLTATSSVQSTPPTPTERAGTQMKLAPPKVPPVSVVVPKPTTESSPLFNFPETNGVSRTLPPKAPTPTSMNGVQNNVKQTPPEKPLVSSTVVEPLLSSEPSSSLPYSAQQAPPDISHAERSSAGTLRFTRDHESPEAFNPHTSHIGVEALLQSSPKVPPSRDASGNRFESSRSTRENIPNLRQPPRESLSPPQLQGVKPSPSLEQHQIIVRRAPPSLASTPMHQSPMRSNLRAPLPGPSESKPYVPEKFAVNSQPAMISGYEFKPAPLPTPHSNRGGPLGRWAPPNPVATAPRIPQRTSANFDGQRTIPEESNKDFRVMRPFLSSSIGRINDYCAPHVEPSSQAPFTCPVSLGHESRYTPNYHVDPLRKS